MVPVCSSNRSLSVLLPWSMCATMQKFLYRSRGIAAIRFSSSAARRFSGPSFALLLLLLLLLANRHCCCCCCCCSGEAGKRVGSGVTALDLCARHGRRANDLGNAAPAPVNHRALPAPRIASRAAVDDGRPREGGTRHRRRGHGPIRDSRPGTPRMQLARLGHILWDLGLGALVIVVKEGVRRLSSGGFKVRFQTSL
ncbi:hypothetical protein VTK26DRAFT_237 [Humicola hyalothermophila]